mmetsp:Transcript_1404/g.4775  ORF Transcript_1404/g.4775 Transcript_1404/m.4775 type:complete len:333 (-) Transcript_1404:1160-2158(-)
MNFDIHFEQWVAHRVQAWWRGRRQRLVYQQSKQASMLIQRTWRDYIKFRKLEPDREIMASRIQRAWRRFSSIRIFRYYRELVKFRERGDPRILLRSINPIEADLADAACGVHVRFRLGGDSFPPLIFYKVFTHRPIADVCAYSPKDYVNSCSPTPGETHNHSTGSVPIDTTGWYKRVENNGWRPVTERVLLDVDPVTQHTSARRIIHHYDASVRKSEKIKRKKQRQREWMMKMYEEGKHTGVKKDTNQNSNTTILETSESDEDLLLWTNNLDFEEYQSTWVSLATSCSSAQNFECHTNHVNAPKHTQVDICPATLENEGPYVTVFGENTEVG